MLFYKFILANIAKIGVSFVFLSVLMGSLLVYKKYKENKYKKTIIKTEKEIIDHCYNTTNSKELELCLLKLHKQ